MTTSYYAVVIARLAPDHDPAHVGARMRLEHGTLDNLDPAHFAREGAWASWRSSFVMSVSRDVGKRGSCWPRHSQSGPGATSGLRLAGLLQPDDFTGVRISP